MTVSTRAEIELAAATWGANCGPAALAALLDRPIDDVRGAVSPEATALDPLPAFQGYMGVCDMRLAMRRLGLTWTASGATAQGLGIPRPPAPTIVLVQWGGPWRNVPRAAATHRHWVVRHLDRVYDVNFGWVSRSEWDDAIHAITPPRWDGSYHAAWSATLILMPISTNGATMAS